MSDPVASAKIAEQFMLVGLSERQFEAWEEDRQKQRVTRLATYNSEVHRGLVHTDEWKAYMAEEQAWFDALPRPS